VFNSFGIPLGEDNFQYNLKRAPFLFTDFLIAEAWVSTRISLSFSSSRQQGLLLSRIFLDKQQM
jgi:hypothetical protein